jgi:3',5'-cyclic AMP phosphodiesterase CpdA
MSRAAAALLAIVAAGAAVSAAPADSSDAAPPVRLERHPYVQRAIGDRAVIVWETEEPSRGEVRWGVGGGAALTGRADSGRRLRRRHQVTLRGLPAGERVTYRVFSGEAPLAPPSSFRAAAPPGIPFRFCVLGDSGTGSPAQERVAGQLLRAEPDIVLHAGDLVYPYGARADYEDKFFRPYREVLRSATWFPCIGNHDIISWLGRPWTDTFVLPDEESGTERYYAFDWGDVRFVVLDTAIGALVPGGRQHRWLQGEVARPRPRWWVALLHHPQYSSGVHGSNPLVRAVVEPLLDRARCDAVFSGHDHHYERTHPQGRAGTVHFVTGGGGAPIRRVGKSDFTAVSESAYHLLAVDVDPERMRVRAVRDDGEVIDELELKPRADGSGD